MTTLTMRAAMALFAPVALLCAGTQPALADDHACDDARMIGQFDPTKDLLIANYDSKPDVDDLQAVAGLGSVLAHEDYACVNFVATMGAYGTQTGEFIGSEKLFTMAFGDNWVDAHGDREGAVASLAVKARAALEAGGKIWITEAGQSDVSAAIVRALPREYWGRINLVQHSHWNESTTSADDHHFVRNQIRYHRISDGNFSANGTPNFTTRSSAYWPVLLEDPRIGPLWAEAKQLSEEKNPDAEYVNPAVAAGGLDFSDTVEVAYVFGFDHIDGVGDFVAMFARPE